MRDYWCRYHIAIGHVTRVRYGFTLLELLITIALISVLYAIAVPLVRSIHDDCCLKAAVLEITEMIKEGRLNAQGEKYYAVGFTPASGRVALISDRGPDGQWNTNDDTVIRSFTLPSNGAELKFGYGSHGPLPKRGADADGVTFQNNNTLICNPELTGSSGAVYLIARSGSARAILVNSTDFEWTVWRWEGKWVMQ